MNAEEFEKVFEDTVGMSRDVLLKKAREYASDDDRLHNFKMAAGFTHSTQEKALWGFLVKHLVSLSDMITSDRLYSMDVWDEKIGDSLNYLILLRACVLESTPAAHIRPKEE